MKIEINTRTIFSQILVIIDKKQTEFSQHFLLQYKVLAQTAHE